MSASDPPPYIPPFAHPTSSPTTDKIMDGWVEYANKSLSPNCDERPTGVVPELLVIHAISLPPGQFSTGQPGSCIADLFLNQLDVDAHPDLHQLKEVRVSAHFLILRDGSLHQFVSAGQRAWHAGVSEWRGRERCNDFSIGIELEGSDFVPFEPVQYDALVNLTGLLLQHYPIQDIVGHQDIAPSRKTDPGPFFNWKKFQNLLALTFPLVLANAAIRFHADP